MQQICSVVLLVVVVVVYVVVFVVVSVIGFLFVFVFVFLVFTVVDVFVLYGDIKLGAKSSSICLNQIICIRDEQK